jgi:hypothetical protein
MRNQDYNLLQKRRMQQMLRHWNLNWNWNWNWNLNWNWNSDLGLSSFDWR